VGAAASAFASRGACRSPRDRGPEGGPQAPAIMPLHPTVCRLTASSI
jgi:hypothetical protein